MKTVAHAIRKSLEVRLDHPFIYKDDSTRVTLSDIRYLARLFHESTIESGLAAGDLVLLEFSAADWDLFAAAYIGSHLEGLVPVIISASGGAERRDAAIRDLPVRAVCTPSETGAFDLTVVTAARHQVGGDVAEYLLTSGTTGAPKVVTVSHAARLAVRQPTGNPGITAIAIPPGSNAAQTVLAEALLSNGGLACMKRWSPAGFLDLIATSQAKSALLAPAMAASLVRHPGLRAGTPPTLLSLRLGMAPASRELIKSLAQALPGTTITNIYTTTEAWPAGTVMRYSRDDPRSVGCPLPGTLICVVDIAGLPVPADVQGRVQLAWTPNATEGVAWVETGDIGCLAFDGTLFLSGREGEIVTRGGATVSLAEVESAMVASGLVLDAMSYPIEQAMHGELLGAAVVWAGDADAESLRAYVRERLGSPAVPAVITSVTVIPRDHQGKLTRTPQPAVEPSASPADPVRADLRDIWAEVVGHSSFADADDFFGIGGDSLAAAMCNTLIEERLGVVLPLSMHYEATTLDQLAEAIRANAVRGSGAEGVL